MTEGRRRSGCEGDGEAERHFDDSPVSAIP